MKNIMIKSILLIATVSAIALACSENIFHRDDGEYIKPEFDENGYWKTDGFVVKKNSDETFSYYGTNSLYGAYLAANIANHRQDFDNAAEYYKIVAQKDSENTNVNRAVYLLLSSMGQLDKAAPFARKEIEAGAKNTIAPLIVAVNDAAEGNYPKMRENVALLEGDIYRILVIPMFNAWAYAGEKKEKEAIAEIEKIAVDRSMEPLTLFHKAMIYDYLGNTQKAAQAYETIAQKYPKDVTFRMLEIISDFYARSGDKESAHKISARYNDNSILSLLLENIDKQIDSKTKDSPAIINTPQKGLAEALFNIGTLFRISPNMAEMAQLYLSASSFLNPQYDVAQIAMANVLEELGLYKEANRYYEKINKDSGSYFIAKMKLVENLNTLKEYNKAEEQLRLLLKDYPENTQLLCDLGNIYMNMNNYDEAIKLYKQALQYNNKEWLVYYALGAAYEKINKDDLAIENLKEALHLSQRNPNVLNYLGYKWLESGQNTDEAVRMIIEAYQKSPFEGHIIDSIGWMYYRLGNYKKAIEFLEQASDMNPGNAVINDHLGDAYWFGGRKNEAVFQWKHALVLKEDADQINKDVINAKIEDGKIENKVLQTTDKTLFEILQKLSVNND